MHNLDENIDLDALFDTLNISQNQSYGRLGAASAVSVQPDLGAYEMQHISPIEADFIIVDLPSDQS